VTCGKGQSARKRTCREDGREEFSESDRTCKGTQIEDRTCDSGSCNKLESYGEDYTNSVKRWKRANFQQVLKSIIKSL
jgi:hypothetical protein